MKVGETAVRVILVGPPRERADLRARLNGDFEIVSEAATLADARAIVLAADAFVVVRGVKRARGDDEIAVEPLTDREMQVLELLAEGLSNKAIGTRLEISDQTVKFHVASIAGKLGARNRTEAVRLAVRRGLLSLEARPTPAPPASRVVRPSARRSEERPPQSRCP